MIDKKLIERFIEIVGVNHALVDQDVIHPILSNNAVFITGVPLLYCALPLQKKFRKL